MKKKSWQKNSAIIKTILTSPSFNPSGCRVRVHDVLDLLQQRHVLGPAHPRILLRSPRLHPLHQLRRIDGSRVRNCRSSLHRISRIKIKATPTFVFENLFLKFIFEIYLALLLHFYDQLLFFLSLRDLSMSMLKRMIEALKTC